MPDTLSEYQFAGLLRGAKVELVPAKTVPLLVPAQAEIVIEGHVLLDDYADEGPYGDHTGYYNSVEQFPVFQVTAITMRKDPIYLTTFTGRPPDEPSVLGEALNEVFIPLLRQQFPEIVDFWLPPEGCSYRIAVVSMKKAYPGHAKRVMMGVWSYLRQFMYTKWVIVVDDDIDARDWKDVMWAISTRMDPARDITVIENTPIDYLDFASPESGLGSKIGLDATDKWPPETQREWGRQLGMDAATVEAVTEKWAQAGPARRRQAGRLTCGGAKRATAPLRGANAWTSRASAHAAALWVGLHLILLLVLSVLVVRQRRKHGVVLGDAGVPELAQAVRAFGNATEYVPGRPGRPRGAGHGRRAAAGGARRSGLTLFVGRVAHAVGLSRSGGASLPRVGRA